jgi:uncharacterized NAD(P)/FAD-binding protein YdhS
LIVRAGRVAAIVPCGDAFDVSIALRGGGVERAGVQRIINCVGPQADLTRIRQNLVRSMISKGLICADPLKIGAEMNDEAMMIGSNGKSIANLYAIGPLRKGQLWECTAIPEIREQAKQMAETVLARLSLKASCATAGSQVTNVPFNTGTVAAPVTI